MYGLNLLEHTAYLIGLPWEIHLTQGWAYNIDNESYIKYDRCIFKLYMLKFHIY